MAYCTAFPSAADSAEMDHPAIQCSEAAQAHEKDGTIEQRHSCILIDVGPFSEIPGSLKGRLDATPREVVTLLITSGADNFDVARYADVFAETGMEQYVFLSDGRLGLEDWSTFGQLMDDGTRLFLVYRVTAEC